MGHEKIGPDDANLLFRAVNIRYEKGSIVLTNNLPFGDWGEYMGNNVIASATLDRLLYHSMVFSFKGNSYRMKGRLEPLKRQNHLKEEIIIGEKRKLFVGVDSSSAGAIVLSGKLVFARQLSPTGKTL